MGSPSRGGWFPPAAKGEKNKMVYDFNRPVDRWDNYAGKYDELEQK